MITFDGFPLPISENQAYANFRKGGGKHSPTKEFRKFLKAVELWAKARPSLIRSAGFALDDHLKQTPYNHVRIDVALGFKQERLFWKTSGYRRPLDAQNHIKVLFDVLANLTGHDDSRFYPGIIEPGFVPQDIPESCTILIRPDKLGTFKKIRQKLLDAPCQVNPTV